MSGGDGFTTPGVSVQGLSQDPESNRDYTHSVALQAMSTLLNNTDLSTYMQRTLWPAWRGNNAPSPGQGYQVLEDRESGITTIQVENSKVVVQISSVSSPAFLVPILQDLSLCRVMGFIAATYSSTDLGASLRTAITKSIEILSHQLLSESSTIADPDMY